MAKCISQKYQFIWTLKLLISKIIFYSELIIKSKRIKLKKKMGSLLTEFLKLIFLE